MCAGRFFTNHFRETNMSPTVILSDPWHGIAVKPAINESSESENNYQSRWSVFVLSTIFEAENENF